MDIIEAFFGLLEIAGLGFPSKAHKNIQQLETEDWFKALIDDYRYNYIIYHNKKVNKFLSKSKNIKLLLHSEESRSKFIELVHREHAVYVGLK